MKYLKQKYQAFIPIHEYPFVLMLIKKKERKQLFVRIEVLRPSQPNGVHVERGQFILRKQKKRKSSALLTEPNKEDYYTIIPLLQEEENMKPNEPLVNTKSCYTYLLSHHQYTCTCTIYLQTSEINQDIILFSQLFFYSILNANLSQHMGKGTYHMGKQQKLR